MLYHPITFADQVCCEEGDAPEPAEHTKKVWIEPRCTPEVTSDCCWNWGFRGPGEPCARGCSICMPRQRAGLLVSEEWKVILPGRMVGKVV